MGAPTPELACVSIVVLSHNRREALRRNLVALLAMAEGAGCELIVVDNASADGSAALIASMLAGRAGATFIANAGNLGVAAGRNCGWRASGREFILNLDEDIWISAEDIAQLADLLHRSPTIGVVGPKILDLATGAIQHGFGDSPASIANFQGACHMIRRELAEHIGYNDERCLFGGEELDLSIRVRAAGFDVLYLPDATALHDHKERRGSEAKDRRERWVYNHARVFGRHFPLSSALPLSLRYLASHVVSGWRAHGPRLAARLVAAALRGFREGRREHRPVPEPVLRFYRDPDLRPEFGNRPLWRKLMERHVRS